MSDYRVIQQVALLLQELLFDDQSALAVFERATLIPGYETLPEGPVLRRELDNAGSSRITSR